MKFIKDYIDDNNRSNVCIICFERKKEGVLIEECPYDFEGLYDCFICFDCIIKLNLIMKMGGDYKG